MDEVNVKKPTTTTVVRRGIGTARGTQRLKFTERNAQSNGLFIGHLDSVDVSMIKIGEETTGMPSFNGLEIPKIRFTFASNEDDIAKRKYAVLSFNAVESNVETIPGGKSEWKVNVVLNWIKHILDIFIFKGRPITEEEEAKFSLSYVDYDENGEYVPVSPETVIAGWKGLFENIEDILNRGKDGSEYYKSNGKPIAIWMKLIRYIKNNKKGWTPVTNGDLSFPTFIGEGCIELYKTNVIPGIHLNPISECITPKNIEKPTPKQPNMAIPSGMAGFGGVNMDGFAQIDNSFNMGGIPTDMPFSDDLPE